MSIKHTQRGRSGSPDYVYTPAGFHRQACFRGFPAKSAKSSIAYTILVSQRVRPWARRALFLSFCPGTLCPICTHDPGSQNRRASHSLIPPVRCHGSTFPWVCCFTPFRSSVPAYPIRAWCRQTNRRLLCGHPRSIRYSICQTDAPENGPLPARWLHSIVAWYHPMNRRAGVGCRA